MINAQVSKNAKGLALPTLFCIQSIIMLIKRKRTLAS